MHLDISASSLLIVIYHGSHGSFIMNQETLLVYYNYITFSCSIYIKFDSNLEVIELSDLLGASYLLYYNNDLAPLSDVTDTLTYDH